MKYFWILFFLVPQLSLAMGMFFRRGIFDSLSDYEMMGQKVGINKETCAYIYASDKSLFREYEMTCMAGKNSLPIEVSSDCNYDDYNRNNRYESIPVQLSLTNSLDAQIEKNFQELQYGVSRLQPVWDLLKSNYQNSTGYVDAELLLGKYCQRATPTTTANAFSMNTDVPAEIISFWDHKYLKNMWEPKLEYLKARYPEFEVQDIYDLNLQAADLWEKIMICADQNPEVARYSYFRGEFNCSNGLEIKDSIKNYVTSVRMQLTTSYKKPIELKTKSAALITYSISRGEKLYESRYTSLPSYHPLYTQALLQILVDIFPAGSSDRVSLQDYQRRIGIKDSQETTLFIQNLSQLDDLWPKGLLPMGLWPTAGFTAFSQVQSKRMKLITLILKDIQITEFQDLYIKGFRKPDPFYVKNRAQLVDEIRMMNQRYGIKNTNP